MKINFLFIYFVSLFFAQAIAQPRCSCSNENIQGSCSANITIDENVITGTSSVQNCSRVDWFADGKAQLLIIMDGIEHHSWIFDMPEKVVVHSCLVCKDSKYPGQIITDSSKVNKASSQSISGSWRGESRNVFGRKFYTDAYIQIDSELNISGQWKVSNAPRSAEISGIYKPNDESLVTVHGVTNAKLRLKLVDDNTINYKWRYGSGELKRIH